jgi:very-short-patch-repair endonuclease
MGWDSNLPPLHGEGQPTRRVGRVGKSAATTKRARELRQHLTQQEARLWVHLRTLRPEGYHFRRQAPLLGFFLDFVCFKHRLVIEIDGSQHGEDVQSDHDAMRDNILRRAGFRTLRFWNSDIDSNLDGVMLTIQQALGLHPSPSWGGTADPKDRQGGGVRRDDHAQTTSNPSSDFPTLAPRTRSGGPVPPHRGGGT